MSTPELVILIADENPGHARLIEKNLIQAGLNKTIKRFDNGQALLDFLFQRGPAKRAAETAYLLLLDIRIPEVDGLEVLRQLKQDDVLKKIPVIILTAKDDPREVERCHALGCSNYIVKPNDNNEFAEAIKSVGAYLSLVRVPKLGGSPT